MLLQLFGRPKFLGIGQTKYNLPAKAYLAIALLTIRSGGMARRSVLASWLWEDHSSKLANANLRQLLAGVRRFEGEHSTQIIKTNRHEVRLDAGLAIDLTQFEETKAIDHPEELRLFVTNFQCDFLQGLEDAVGADAGHWILSLRQEFNHRFLQVARESALQFGGQIGSETLEALLSLQPYDEAIFRALILVHSRSKNELTVHQRFRSFARQLQRDLGVSPSSQTLDLLARVVPEMIPELERDFSFLTKRGVSVAETSENGPTRNMPHCSPKHGLPRLLILPPSGIAAGLRTTDQTYVSHVIEDLTLCLCRMRSLVVLAPHTAKKFVKLDHPQVALDVDYLVATRILPNRSSWKIAICLTEVSTGEVLMAEEIPFEISSVFLNSVQFIQSVSTRIGLEIDQSVLAVFRRTERPSTYTHYLLGRERLQPYDLPSIRGARKAFERALKLSPNYIPAQQMLARTYRFEWWILGRKEDILLEKAKELSNGVISNDPIAPGGYWELANSLLYLGDIDRALENVATASELAPNHADIIADMADINIHHGRHLIALDLIDSALELNPLPPDDYYWIRAGCSFLSENYREALNSISATSERFPATLRMVAACHAMLGNIEQANRARKSYMSEYPDFRLCNWKKLMPVKEEAYINHYVDAMHLAGFR